MRTQLNRGSVESVRYQQLFVQEISMAPKPDHSQPDAEQDVVESIVHHMPVVLPVAGAVLIFLLAFIAVVMA